MLPVQLSWKVVLPLAVVIPVVLSRSLVTGAGFYRWRSVDKETARKKKVVVITGCDSGLGYSMSKWCQDLGFSVVSGCLDLQSDGATELSWHSTVFPLDVRQPQSVDSFLCEVSQILTNKNQELHAVVNNAGVMIFGEFEWQTEEQMLLQIGVNQIGTFRVAKAFLPLLRKHKGRLINVTSHCAFSSLPGVSVYGSTKAAVQNWSDGLRVEQRKYGVKVITFIPGSFPLQSNIMARQKFYAQEMENALSTEDQRFFGNYFKNFHSYLINLPKTPLSQITDVALHRKFEHSLLGKRPSSMYVHEPWRYTFYYNLFRFTPVRLRDILVERFMQFPKYEPHAK